MNLLITILIGLIVLSLILYALRSMPITVPVSSWIRVLVILIFALWVLRVSGILSGI